MIKYKVFQKSYQQYFYYLLYRYILATYSLEKIIFIGQLLEEVFHFGEE